MWSDRRRSARVPCRVVVEVSVRPEWPFVPCEARNVSTVGICVRFPKELELRSPVRLRLWKVSGEPIECEGSVNWTMGRSDICQEPPYPYDIGIEFDQVSSAARMLLTTLVEQCGQGRSERLDPHPAEEAGVVPITIGGQRYVPTLVYQPESGSWSLIVYRDQTPYYSQRFPTSNAATQQWQAFKTTITKMAERS